jgi:hypothetical protein
MSSPTDSLSQYAEKYHSLGMAVHPLGFGGKSPLATEWSSPPRLSLDELLLSLQKPKVTGLGFCAGYMSNGLSVLDFDQEWQNSLEQFLHCWPNLIHTGLWSTAHDRRQMILRINNLPNSQTITKFQRGPAIIELRCNGANNVLPPSFHAKCNKPYCGGDSYYEWTGDEIEFCEIEFNDLFGWLGEWGQVVEDGSKEEIPERPVIVGNIDRLLAAQEATRAISTARKMIQTSKDGYKYNTLLRASGLLGGYVGVGVLERECAASILQEEIDAKSNVDDYDVAYKAIDAGLEWGSKRPFTAEKILTDKLDYAKQQNGNGNSATILLPSVTIETPEAPRITFKPWVWAEFLTRPPKRWYVENFIGPGDVVVLAGDSGSGKTVIVLDLAICAVLRKMYAGRFSILDPLKIAYCTAEGLGNLPARVKAAIAQHSVPLSIIEEQFFGYDGPIIPQFFLTSNSEYSIEQFERDLQALNLTPDILIVDTLALAAMGGNLEDNFDATAALIRARQFTNRTNTAVLFTHHNNREGTFRGAASLRDNADGLFVARYDKDNDERKLLCKDDKWGKLKDGEEWPGLLYTLESHPEHDAPIVKWLGEYVPGRKQDELDFREELFDILPMGKELSGDEINAALKDLFAPGTIRNGLSRLVKNKELERTYAEPDKAPSRSNPAKFKRTIKSMV